MRTQSMMESELRRSLNGETIYLVLLEFPVENGSDENSAWLQSLRTEVERFCDEYCFKIGALHILPKPYFPIVESFLRKVKQKYKKMGYNPTFKFLQANLRGVDYLDLQRLIMERIRLRLEVCLSKLEGEERDNLFSEVLKEVTKANELMLIFQLGKMFPQEAVKVYDLMSILNEKIADFKLQKSREVVVTELEGYG